jgi:hypothetical protein
MYLMLLSLNLLICKMRVRKLTFQVVVKIMYAKKCLM